MPNTANAASPRLLLLQLPTTHQRIFPVPPLGPAIIIGYLRKRGFRVEVSDLEMLTWHHDEFDIPMLHHYFQYLPKRFNNRKRVFSNTERVYRHLRRGGDDPRICSKLEEWLVALEHDIKSFTHIGFSVMGPFNLGTSLCFAQHIRKRTNAKIIFGGGYITPRMKKLLSIYSFLDYLIVGEGECALEQMLKGDSLDTINNLIYRTNKVVCNPMHTGFLPFSTPDFSSFPLQKYKELTCSVMPMVTSKGCRNACNFCITGQQKPFFKDPNDVVQEFENILNVGNTNMVGMFDNAINIDRSFSIKLCQLILERGLTVKWSAYFIPVLEEKEYFDLLRRAGCIQLRWGIETGSNTLLKRMNKAIKLDVIPVSLKRAHRMGIWNHLLFCCDHPDETLEDWALTIQFIRENKDIFRSAVINPFDFQRIDPTYHDAKIFEKSLNRETELKFHNLYGIDFIDYRSSSFGFKYNTLRWALKACGISAINNTSNYKRDLHKDHYYFKCFMETLEKA